MPLKFAIYTLGCKVNQYEEGIMRKILLEGGFQETNPGETADLYIINTCTVTREADRKCRQIIRRAMKANPEAVIIIAGCAVESGIEIEGDGKNRIIRIKNEEKENILEILREKADLSIISSPDTSSVELSPFDADQNPIEGRSRALLKVQDGCDHFCTYCIVPHVRGRSRSKPPDEILFELENLVDAGFQEVVITGIHLGDYGKSINRNWNLSRLLRFLCENSRIKRLRLSSIEPPDFTSEMLDCMARYPAICPHLHLPLQHASDKILKKMNRGYTLGEFDSKVTLIRDRIPGIAITTDIIVGFPGETEEDFDILCDYIIGARFSRLHVFVYSEREGTPAASFPGSVEKKTRQARSRRLIRLGKELSMEYMESHIGHELEILAESRFSDDLTEGISAEYIRTLVSGGEIEKGKIVKGIGIRIEGDFLVCERLN